MGVGSLEWLNMADMDIPMVKMVDITDKTIVFMQKGTPPGPTKYMSRILCYTRHKTK